MLLTGYRAVIKTSSNNIIVATKITVYQMCGFVVEQGFI